MAKKIDSTSSKRNSTRTFFWLSAACGLAAIPVHLYLLSEHYGLRFGEASGSSICNISELFSCAATAASKYSEVFGIPVALLGIVVNTSFLALMLFHLMTDDEKKPASRRNLLTLASAIALVSLVMGSISTFMIGRFCPFCMLAYLLSFLMLGFLWVALPKKAVSPVAARAPSIGDFTPLIVALAIAGLTAMITNDTIVKGYGFNNIGPVAQQYVQEWAASPQLQVQPIEPLVRGAPVDKAVMTITEFADFLCIHCKHAAPKLEAFAQAHPDVRLNFQAWPLDGECNTKISSSHGMGCLLARTVFCTEKVSGRGWDAHRYVYDHQDSFRSLDAVKSAIPKISEVAGANPEQVLACTQSPEMKTLIEKQAQLGSSLNMQGTPTIFVNGKRLEGGQILPVLDEAYRVLKQAK